MTNVEVISAEYLLPCVRCAFGRVRIRTDCDRMRYLQQESYGGRTRLLRHCKCACVWTRSWTKKCQRLLFCCQYVATIWLKNRMRMRTMFADFEENLIAHWQYNELERIQQ